MPDAPGADVLVVVGADGARRRSCEAADAEIEPVDGLRRHALARPRPLRRRARRGARRHAEARGDRLVRRAGAAGRRGGRRDRAARSRRASPTPRSASRSAARSAPTRRSSTSWWRSCAGSRTPARSCTTRAGRPQDKPEELPVAASAFRLVASEAYDHAARAQISVHGGIGATWEHDAPLYFRRAQLDKRLLGGDRRRGRPGRRRAVRAGEGGAPRLNGSGPTTAGASRSPSATGSRSTSTRCCASGWWRTGSRAPDEVLEPEPGAVGVAGGGARRRAAGADPRRDADAARAARARAAVVGGAGRARAAGGRRHASRRRATRSSTASGMNLGGGTHHAGRDFARGYCLFNDVAVALRRAARRGPRRARAGASTATSTRATAPPTCSAGDPRAFTVSLHGARNYPFQRIPSDLDVDLASGTGDDALPARRSTRRSTSPCRARRPTSPSTSPAPTRGRATGSAGSR